MKGDQGRHWGLANITMLMIGLALLATGLVVHSRLGPDRGFLPLLGFVGVGSVVGVVAAPTRRDRLVSVIRSIVYFAILIFVVFGFRPTEARHQSPAAWAGFGVAVGFILAKCETLTRRRDGVGGTMPRTFARP
jgi:hypothetical protein